MARPLRIEYAGAVYHVTSRGNGRQKIFHDDHDNRKFLEVLGKTLHRYHWVCHAFCLMVNHYHLMIETPEANLSKGMHHLNAAFCQAHNKRHDTVGHLFQGRFKAIVVDRESYLLELARYVVLNPVRAGMVARPEDWPWSSYRATVGLPPAPVLISDAAGAAASPSVSGASTADDAPNTSDASDPSSASATVAPNASTFGDTNAAAANAVSSADAHASSSSATAPDAPAPAPGAPSEFVAAASSWLLSQFGPDEMSARQRYCDFVSAGIGKESPWPKLQSQIFLGKETFIDRIKEAIPEKTAVQEIPKLQRYANRPPLKEIFGGGKTRRKRDEGIVASYVTYGYEQREIANFLELHYTTVCRVIRRYDEKR